MRRPSISLSLAVSLAGPLLLACGSAATAGASPDPGGPPPGHASPVITAQPRSVTVVAGAAASFAVMATGDGALGFQWRKDGAVLAGRTAATLSLASVQSSDAGSYACVVTSTVGGSTTSATSTPATLAVNVPPAFSVQPQAVTVAAGATATFGAAATGNGAVTYQWQRDGADLVGRTSPTLSIAGVQDADAGSYRVAATNTLDGTVTSAVSTAAALTVTHPPVISSVTAAPGTVAIGGTVSLLVTASDPLARPLGYGWTASPSGCGTFSTTTAASTTLTAASAGPCTVTATVTAGGQAATRSVVVTVVSPGGAVPAAMPRVAHSYTVMSANGATTPAAAIAGLGAAVVVWSRGGDTGPGDGNVQDGYDARLSDPALGGTIDNPASNVPIDYVVEGSAGGGTWTTLVAVAGNTAMVRGHAVDLTGYTGVRLRLTSAPRRPASVFGTDFSVHDARAGRDDWWLFLGDSITTNVFHVHDSTKFGSNVHARLATRFPVAHEGGISQGRIADLLWTGWQGSDGRPLLARWLDDFPGRYVSLGIGTNDVNGGLGAIDTMDADFRRLVDLVLAAGKVPVVPTLRWNSVGGSSMPTWHARLAAIVAAKPGALRGPDLYTRSLAQGSAGLLDGVHANAAGVALTQDDWATWAVGTFYAGGP